MTGGTSGIGLAVAERYVAEGARVVVCGRDLQRVRVIANTLGPGHVGIACDLSSVVAIEQLVRDAHRAVGELDIVFAGAGVAFYKSLADWSEQDFDRLFAINAKGQFFTAQKSAPYMRDGGVIILVGSVASRLGQPDMAVYAASKAVAPTLAKNLSADLVPRRIRVVCLTPGPVDTPIFEHGGLSSEAARKKLKEVSQRVPLGRAGRPSELAAVAVFLASEASSYMLGAEVVVDGGKSQL